MIARYFATKFREVVAVMGFTKVEQMGSALSVEWRMSHEEPLAKRRKVDVGNVMQECAICSHKRHMVAAAPCGHLSCKGCLDKIKAAQGKCAFWSSPVSGMLPIFKP